MMYDEELFASGATDRNAQAILSNTQPGVCNDGGLPEQVDRMLSELGRCGRAEEAARADWMLGELCWGGKAQRRKERA